MTPRLSFDVIVGAFIAACRDELSALKPGNVHIHAAGHGMAVSQFEASAEAAAPFIADPRLKVGRRIRRAVEASFAAAGCNTNLGILLLCAPLAAAVTTPAVLESPPPNLAHKGGGALSREAGGSPPAIRDTEVEGLSTGPSPLAGEAGRGGTTAPEGELLLRRSLSCVLDALDAEDAAEVFRAIALARPAGLGTVEDQDVAKPPTAPLKEAMALAAARDRIARAYVTDFADVFERGLPALRDARVHAASPDLAVTTLHMTFLAAFADSHIARKHGWAAADEVRRSAGTRRNQWYPAVPATAFADLLAFDGDLKARGLNPGTTADLVVATLFGERLAALIQP